MDRKEIQRLIREGKYVLIFRRSKRRSSVKERFSKSILTTHVAKVVSSSVLPELIRSMRLWDGQREGEMARKY